MFPPPPGIRPRPVIIAGVDRDNVRGEPARPRRAPNSSPRERSTDRLGSLAIRFLNSLDFGLDSLAFRREMSPTGGPDALPFRFAVSLSAQRLTPDVDGRGELAGVARRDLDGDGDEAPALVLGPCHVSRDLARLNEGTDDVV